MTDHLAVAYSWSFGNIGDIGITNGLLNQVLRRQPDQPIKVLAPQSSTNDYFARAKDYYESKYVSCEVVPSPFTSSGGGEGAWAGFLSRWNEHRLDSFIKGCLDSTEAQGMADDLLGTFAEDVIEEFVRAGHPGIDALRHAGFLVYNSGMTLNFGHLGQRTFGRTLHNIMPLVVARSLGVPYGINAQSFDAVEWPVELIYRPLLRDAAFVYCRDSDSVSYLRQRRLGHPEMSFKPDTMFYFSERDDAWADDFLQRNGLAERDFLAVIIRVVADKPVSSDMAGGTVSAERRDAHLAKVRQLIEEWVVRTGRKVLVCHELSRSIESTRTMLWDTIGDQARDRCVYLDEFWLPEQSCAVLSRARALVSMEAHSVLMALGNGTPAVHIPFAEAGRKRAMMIDFDLADWLHDIDRCTGEELVETLMSIDRHQDAARSRTVELRVRMQKETDAVLDSIRTNWRMTKEEDQG